jgi:hypothetical protein
VRVLSPNCNWLQPGKSWEVFIANTCAQIYRLTDNTKMGHAHSLELKSASSRLVKRAVTSAILISLVANGSFASKARQQPRKSNSGSDSGGFWGAVESVLDFATSGGGGHSDRSAGARREVSRRDGREYQVVVRSWKEANGRFGSGFFS